jgi:DNA polymerase III subunit epsilon
LDTQASATIQATIKYPGLIERALECIEQHRGAIDEDALIAHVFGSSSSAALWRSLLRSVLADHPRVSLRPDGVWTTGRRHDDDTFQSEFIVLDIETTGLKPSQQRIIEVGIIRVSPSGSPLKWTSLVNPAKPVPQYVAGLTGIDDLMVASAPEFRSIAPTIVEIVGDLPVVGHNVDFDIAFINAELMRCGLPSLVNTTVDTLSLANRFARESRRLSLPDVARSIGVSSSGAHRALVDAETTLDVFRILLARAREQGVGTMEEILQACASGRPSKPSRTAVGRGRAVLDRSLLDPIPSAPGVYIMRDTNNRVLYVGKARNLRKRVASYYSQPLGYTRKMDGLLETLSSIEVEVVGSELEALTLESQLIRRYRPRFNTVQRNVEQYVYVKIDVSNRWPRVVTVRDRSEDGALYFGPFRSSSRAREAVSIVNDILPLRTCRRSFNDSRSYGSPCLELSLKRCLGPCMGIADPDEYRGLVHDVIRFFRGDGSRLVDHLHRKLEQTVETLDFERAARLRDQIQRIEALSLEQQRLDTVRQHTHALLVLPGASPRCREVWYLLRGQRWAQLRVEDDCSIDDLAARLSAIRSRAEVHGASFVPNHHAVDEMSILARWMRKTPVTRR